MPEAGWYDDPQGGGGKRWWDGERWSEHTTPPPGTLPDTPTAAPAAQPPAPAAAPAAPSWEQQAGAGGWQAAAGTPASPTGQPTASKGGAGKIVALILGLVVVVGIGVVVALLVSGSDDVDVVVADVRQADGQTVQVPEDGTWEMEVDLPAGRVVIDVRGIDGFDPVLELYDASGTRIDRNDDRSSSQLDQYGGGFFDSLIETEIPAGRYRVVVEGFAGHGGRATVAFPVTGG